MVEMVETCKIYTRFHLMYPQFLPHKTWILLVKVVGGWLIFSSWLIWHPKQKTLGLFPWCWPPISIRRLRKNHQIISKIYPFTTLILVNIPIYEALKGSNARFQRLLPKSPFPKYAPKSFTLGTRWNTTRFFFLRKNRRFVQLQPPPMVLGFPFLCQNVRLIRCHFVFRKSLMFCSHKKRGKNHFRWGSLGFWTRRGWNTRSSYIATTFLSFLTLHKLFDSFLPSCFLVNKYPLMILYLTLSWTGSLLTTTIFAPGYQDPKRSSLA